MTLFNFEAHTPQRRFFDDKVQAIVITLLDGEMGIYAKHSPFVGVSVTGILKILDSEGCWKTAFATGGILEVKEYKTVLMTDIAEWPEEIDKDSVLAAKQEAEEILKESQFKFEIEKAKENLRRAEFRLKILEECPIEQNPKK